MASLGPHRHGGAGDRGAGPSAQTETTAMGSPPSKDSVLDPGPGNVAVEEGIRGKRAQAFLLLLWWGGGSWSREVCREV